MSPWILVVVAVTWVASVLAAFLAGVAFATINVDAMQELEEAR